MNCARSENGAVNRKRLAVLVGILGVFGVGIIYTAFALPILVGFLPLLLFAALCPASCAVGKVVSWVRGGKETSEVQTERIPPRL